jgi:hypothetical protein
MIRFDGDLCSDRAFPFCHAYRTLPFTLNSLSLALLLLLVTSTSSLEIPVQRLDTLYCCYFFPKMSSNSSGAYLPPSHRQNFQQEQPEQNNNQWRVVEHRRNNQTSQRGRGRGRGWGGGQVRQQGDYWRPPHTLGQSNGNWRNTSHKYVEVPSTSRYRCTDIFAAQPTRI